MTAEDAINVFKEEFCGLEAYCEIQRDGLCITDNCEVWWAIKALEQCKADIVDVVRCKDCKHRFVNEHYGEKGYMKIKAMCSLDTDDPFELGRNAYDDNWFCADGERKDG